MKLKSPQLQEIPMNIVGSSVFGQYPKISDEQTINMIISDNFLVPYFGYKTISTVNPNGVGRCIFVSTKLNTIAAVIGSGFYLLGINGTQSLVGTLNSSIGTVYMDENNSSEICIVDGSNIYLYNYASSTFTIVSTDIVNPIHVYFMDGYFIVTDANMNNWRLSNPNDGTSFPSDAQHTGEFQTEINKIKACHRVPGKGNLLYVFGDAITEPWYDLGLQLFPFQKNTFFNIDFGTANAATIASNDQYIIWLGQNKQSQPVIMYSEGSNSQSISTDGINKKLAQVNFPSNSYGFLIKQNGHTIYQLTFADPSDNFTLAYDFDTKKFYTITDTYMNCHPITGVVLFQGTYYGISVKNGNLYKLSGNLFTYDGNEIPMIRIPGTTRLPDGSLFIVNTVNFLIEQGQPNSQIIINPHEFSLGQAPIYGTPRVDLSVSYDGGNSFSSNEGIELNPNAVRQNKLEWQNKGACNEFTPQFRFHGFQRFLASSGITSIYQ